MTLVQIQKDGDTYKVPRNPDQPTPAPSRRTATASSSTRTS